MKAVGTSSDCVLLGQPYLDVKRDMVAISMSLNGKAGTIYLKIRVTGPCRLL